MYSCGDTLAGGLPHSDIHGSKPARGSPWLFAACHVLHRLLVPRHPPNALITLEITEIRRSGSQPTMHRNHPQGCSWAERFALSTHSHDASEPIRRSLAACAAGQTCDPHPIEHVRSDPLRLRPETHQNLIHPDKEQNRPVPRNEPC